MDQNIDDLDGYMFKDGGREEPPERSLFQRVVYEVRNYWEWLWPIVAAVSLASIIVVFFVALVKSSDDERKAFMSDCLKDRKQYECTAMWRAGESHTVPVFIPISTGR